MLTGAASVVRWADFSETLKRSVAVATLKLNHRKKQCQRAAIDVPGSACVSRALDVVKSAIQACGNLCEDEPLWSALTGADC